MPYAFTGIPAAGFYSFCLQRGYFLYGKLNKHIAVVTGIQRTINGGNILIECNINYAALTAVT